MANPVITPCPEGQWTLIAATVTNGIVHRKSTGPSVYLQTYRDAGDAAPTEQSEGVQVFIEGDQAEISAVAAIDVYLYAVGSDGSVRVDL